MPSAVIAPKTSSELSAESLEQKLTLTPYSNDQVNAYKKRQSIHIKDPQAQQDFWTLQSLDEHQKQYGAVPSYIQALIDLIQGSAPNVELFIEACKDGDPLLWVKQGDERQCVAIWDESGPIEP